MLISSLLYYFYYLFFDERIYLTAKLNNATESTTFSQHQKKISEICKNCSYINIFGQRIRLFKNIFSQLPLLEHLTLLEMDITSVEIDAFNNLPLLRHLAITDSNLHTIQTGVFNLPKNNSLETINLSRNNIAKIDADVFLNFQKLKTVNLGSNKLTHFDAEWFRNCHNITAINLRDNRILYLDDYDFVAVRNSREKPISLIFSYNRIVEIGFSAFRNLEFVDTMMLDNNHLESVKKINFNNVKYMRKLDLTNNPLKIEDFSFNKLKLLVVSVSSEEACKKLRVSLRVNQSLECAQYY